MTTDEIIAQLPAHWPLSKMRAQAAEAARVAQYHADAHARLAEAQQRLQAAESAFDMDVIVAARRHVADFKDLCANLPEIPSISDSEAIDVAGGELSAAVAKVTGIRPVLSVEMELPAWSSVPLTIRGEPGYQQPATLPGERALEAQLREFRAERESLAQAAAVWPQQWPGTLEALRVAAGMIEQSRRAVVTGEGVARDVAEANQLRTVQGYDWSHLQPGFRLASSISTPEIRALAKYREQQREAVPA